MNSQVPLELRESILGADWLGGGVGAVEAGVTPSDGKSMCNSSPSPWKAAAAPHLPPPVPPQPYPPPAIQPRTNRKKPRVSAAPRREEQSRCQASTTNNAAFLLSQR
ncbi:hypothetical protein J6590_050805 [Homalodisca vitripennis]|nr:hypothetical protein J6590_050805 [Homalodisca vitripennis]